MKKNFNPSEKVLELMNKFLNINHDKCIILTWDGKDTVLSRNKRIKDEEIITRLQFALIKSKLGNDIGISFEDNLNKFLE